MSDDQDECMGRIEPILDELYDALHDGMAVYQDASNYSPMVVAQQRSRTAKGCVFDHAFHALNDKLGSRSGCHFLSIKGLEVLNFRDLAVIRLKHVNGSGRARSFQTAQQRDYDDQKSFLPFLPDAAKRLVVGYESDAVFSAIDRIIVSRPIGRNILWTSQITKLGGAASWADITPVRIEGTDRVDFDAERARRRRT